MSYVAAKNVNLKLICITKRLFHLSEINNARPPHHRSAFRKIRNFPFFKSFYDTDTSQPLDIVIDEIKTYPPGKWGSMPIKNAWKRYKEGKCLQNLPTNFEKLQSMTWTEYNTWYHTLQLPLQFPETLHFSQFVTRTQLIYDIPDSIKDSFNNISSEEIGKTSKMLKIHLENYFSQNAPFLARHDNEEREHQSNEFVSQIMDNIARSRHDLSFYDNYSTSPNSIIETFIKRGSYDELEAAEIVKDLEGCVKYRMRGNLAWQLRSKDLLKQFVNIDDVTASSDGPHFPKYNYHPKVFGLEPSDCEAFQNIPFTYSVHTNEYARNIPGYWGNNPFKVGDPCAFGVLGVLNTDLSRDFNDLYRLGHSEILDRHQISEAILAGFTWTVAQAQNQGFTIYDELTFPFCSCIMLTDGRQMQMAYYQLNSLTSLWKPEDANLPQNMLWIAPKINIFDLDKSNKSIVHIDEHAIHQLLSTFTLPKSDLTSPADLQPHLHGTPSKLLPQLMLQFDPDTATEKELEQYKLQSRAPQFFKYGKSHPNRAFYPEMRTKSEMDEELRAIVPGIDRVPSDVGMELRGWRLRRERQRQGKKKVLREPTEWR